VYKRSPATAPDEAARKRLASSEHGPLSFVGIAKLDPATGIPEKGFERHEKEQSSETRRNRSAILIDQFVDEILSFEGAVADRDPRDDPGRRTRYGVTRPTFNGWLLRHKLDGRPAVSLDFEQVDATKAAAILRDIMHEDVNLHRLNNDNLAHQLMDMYAMHSWRGVRKIVYEAIDKVMASHGLYSRHEPKLDAPKADQPVGPLALSRLDHLANIGLGDEIEDALVDARLEYVKRLPHFAANPGWVTRIERFRPEPK
jgi:lysozyme family protein